MTRVHTDLSRVPVTVAPSPATSGTSLGVDDASAAKLPDTYPFWGVAVPTGAAPTRANSEIVKVTGGSSAAGTTTYTIVRAQGIPVTTAQTVTTSFDIYDANSAEANIGLNSLIINETPSGTVDGSNAAFDTASTYVAGSIQVYRDGQLMKGGGADYTETDNNTITFTVAPVIGSVLLVTYQHTVSTTGNADTVDGYHANATPTANNIPVLDASAKIPVAALYADGWTPAGETWTYASASTITVPSGAALKYSVGDRIKWTQTTVRYGVIVGVADTVLTIAVNTDYVVATPTAISANYYSHETSPVGYPQWFNYTTTIDGFSSDPTGLVNRFSVNGNICTTIISQDIAGTSDATNFTITAPITAKDIVTYTPQGLGIAQDAGTYFMPVNVYILPNTSLFKLRKTVGGGDTSWTNSGNKNTFFTIAYEI